MCKKIITFITILFIGILMVGCDSTGSLSEKEETSLMDFLVSENYIDEQVELNTDGVGEGELHNYYSDVFVNGNKYVIYVRQVIRKEEYRVFDVSIKDDDENVINNFEVKIDRKNGTTSLYDKN